jgi:hypothetical protein
MSQGDNKSIAFETQAGGKLLSMNADWETTLGAEVDLSDSCRPKYFMQIYDPRSETWVSSDRMRELIETEVNGAFQLTSEVIFHEDTS